ncbi:MULTISPECIES: ArnT family glycosyltransferase [Lacticaseibacillus]|uniref:Glycosyltransferase n=1 Tax=Lacticaseibacillus casei DSM 20011 = JCM 1134 = ATCC 393 TaxID=1423732 RepID=A0AAD1AP47_LACCA|nr:glycosyltransferase family 39 protein [Lacticaseibacillus casei]MBI6596502.1 glycosyltransferase family 39 protein [Lacticaseibacillus casei]MBO1480193.1 glycosyltransferase family 39 protein [Lacticaseibacillus casei]MBO2415574.1 glycosyltransferase family 39 protein [Lacticaseibacillus casei]MCK2079831.1 glycosyltransferase family 39 protein [Lacticaseibacillus casei]MDZ5495384.1 glycosyltransferase family 39 protein [Lacticaseibacillus casei]
MKKIRQWTVDWWLIGILILAAFLYAWNIWEAGNANDYYTAAITSMVQSWHNFWYGAFDPAGFITVDKPPVALWFMAISAKIFGVHGWSVVLPSILFGIGSVALIYNMIKPRFNAWAARLAALALTLTPIVVADSRTNNMDATLQFFLLLASWCLMKAISTRKPWLVVVSFALIGVSFNIKMLQAFMILPALLLFYWLASNQKLWRRLTTLGIAAVAMAVTTLAWPMQVDSTAATQRPYVGSSETNSEMELAFGYNGTERLLGQTTGTGAAFPGMGNNAKSKTGGTPPTGATGKTGNPPGGKSTKGTSGQPGTGNTQGGTPPTGTKKQQATVKTKKATGGKMPANFKKGNFKGGPGTGGGAPGGHKGGGGGGGAFSIGTAGPLRLLQSDLGPQISWLVPAALIGFISAFAYYLDRKRKWYQTTSQQNHLLFWMGWLVPVAGFFSIASFFHPYYMIMLAPPIAALFGIGIVTMFKQFKLGFKHWQSWLLPLAIVTTTALQAWYVSLYYQWQTWLVVGAGLIGLALLFIGRTRSWLKSALGVAIAAILVAPGFWSLTPTLAGSSAAITSAGPSLLTSGGNSGGIGSGSVDSGLLKYVEKHQGSAKYLFATSNASTAAPYIIKSGKAVMAIGGFNGTDPAITLKQFKALVKKGDMKYYLSSGRSGNSKIESWVTKVGKKVSSNKYSSQSSSSTKSPGGMGMGGDMGGGTLYELDASMVK